jgi:serpin B
MRKQTTAEEIKMLAKFLTRLVMASMIAAWASEHLLAQDVPAEDIAAVVAGHNDFALDIYRYLAAAGDGDIFLSPFSISSAMSMTYAGARGTTAAEMASALHFDLPADRFHPAAGALLADLTGEDRLQYELSIANRLWGQTGFPWKTEFLNTAQDHYQAGLGELDFMGSPDPSRLTINAWVAEQTQGRIEDLLPAGSITEDTRLVLTNTIYFLGEWTNPFPSQLTVQGVFHSSATENVEIPMMHQSEFFPYLETDEFQLLEMPYKGGDISMLVLLPTDPAGLAELESSLDADMLDSAIASLASTHLAVTLPKFGTTSDFGLKEALQELGMPAAFSDGADFSGLTDIVQLKISDVLHKAYLNVDEEGTEAAAATGVIIEPTSVPDPFDADHPFLFLIRDNQTESILFMGRVVTPEPPAALVPEPATTLLALSGLACLASAWALKRKSEIPSSPPARTRRSAWTVNQ